jgi:ABC-type transporter Mla MlaB component
MVLVFDGPIARSDIPALCQRVRVVLEGGQTGPVVFDVGAITDRDAVTVDALARLQLTARRLGRNVRLRNASRELRELLGFVGLSGVVPCDPALPVDVERQAEQGEQVRRVEEEADPGDPVT